MHDRPADATSAGLVSTVASSSGEKSAFAAAPDSLLSGSRATQLVPGSAGRERRHTCAMRVTTVRWVPSARIHNAGIT